MRVAYHVQTHAWPDQVLRVVDRITRTSAGCVVLVSHDRNGEPLDVARLQALGDVHVLPSSGGYGDFSHVDRYLESVAWLVERDVPFGWYVNLSAQDYPVRPLAEAESELDAGRADGYLLHFPVYDDAAPWPRRMSRTRYEYRHRAYPLLRRHQRLVRPLAVANYLQPWVRVQAAFGSVGVRRRSPFGQDLVLHGGSFWCSLSRACVEYLLEHSRTHPELVDFFRGTLAADEVYTHTVLANSGRFTLDRDCKRYFDFTGSKGNHPRTLGVADLPAILASGAHFARKVDPHDPALMDRLDEQVLRPVPR